MAPLMTVDLGQDTWFFSYAHDSILFNKNLQNASAESDMPLVPSASELNQSDFLRLKGVKVLNLSSLSEEFSDDIFVACYRKDSCINE